MLPAWPIALESGRLHLSRTPWMVGAGGIALMLALVPASAFAQDGDAAVAAETADPDENEGPGEREERDLLTTPLPPIDSSETPDAPASEGEIAFEADNLAYDSNGETVTATGNVVLRSVDRSVRADKVVWNRATGQIVGSGNVRFVDEEGNQLYTQRIELTERGRTSTNHSGNSSTRPNLRTRLPFRS